jgi:hypothetical protein
MFVFNISVILQVFNNVTVKVFVCFYGDVVYKLRKIMGHSTFSAVFTKIIKRYIQRFYDLIILRISACLVFNPFTVGRYAFLF